MAKVGRLALGLVQHPALGRDSSQAAVGRPGILARILPVMVQAQDFVFLAQVGRLRVLARILTLRIKTLTLGPATRELEILGSRLLLSRVLDSGLTRDAVSRAGITPARILESPAAIETFAQVGLARSWASSLDLSKEQ